MYNIITIMHPTNPSQRKTEEIMKDIYNHAGHFNFLFPNKIVKMDTEYRNGTCSITRFIFI